MKIHVKCYAGYRAEETPQRFSAGGRHIDIVEIIRRWQTPDDRFFQVKGDDGNVYTLKNDGQAWYLE